MGKTGLSFRTPMDYLRDRGRHRSDHPGGVSHRSRNCAVVDYRGGGGSPLDLLVVAIVLLVVAGFVGLVDRYDIQRTYADAYAARHGHIPPLVEWFFQPDADPDV